METLPLTEHEPREAIAIDPRLPDAATTAPAAVVLVCSDRASSGRYRDRSGPLAAAWLAARGYRVVASPELLADDELALAAAVAKAIAPGPRLIVVSGGTGLGPRDVTPQTLDKICDYQILGFGELLRRESLKYSPNAYLSRCGAWVKERSLILALAGSPQAVAEQLEIVADLLPRALTALGGNCRHDSHCSTLPTGDTP